MVVWGSRQQYTSLVFQSYRYVRIGVKGLPKTSLEGHHLVFLSHLLKGMTEGGGSIVFSIESWLVNRDPYYG